MTSNINQFLADTNKEIEKMQKKQVAYGIQAITTAHSDLVNTSPKDTGLYMHNHLISENSPSSKTITKTGDSKDELISSKQAQIKDLKFKHGDTIYIQNHLKYAGPTDDPKYKTIEEGHSTYALEGVYGPVERRMEKFLAKKEEI